jgi:branched-chain amino acid transport system substrate-binding protein
MGDRITRRSALAALGAVGAAGLAGCTGGGGSDATATEGDMDTETPTETATDGSGGDGDEGTATGEPGDAGASGTVRVGVIQPITGDLQYYGMQALWGFLSGLAYKADATPPTEIGEGTTTVSVGDVDYELIVRDTQFSADTAQTVATDLVRSQDVDLLFGGTSSGAASRVVQTVVKQAGIPYIAGPAASAGITSNAETCSELVFRASENTAMDARSGGKYVAQETDVSSVYLFGADYSFGRAVVNNYRTVLEQEGVEIVGEKFVPQGYSEWGGLLDNAREAGAGGIVGGFTVATLPNLFTTYLNGEYEFRVFGGFATEITTSIVGQTLAKVLGEPLTAEKLNARKFGPFTTRYHWNQYDNSINDAFVSTYSEAYGKVPDLFTSGTFTAASALVQAVGETGSTAGGDVAEAMRGMTVTDTPKGEGGYTFQEYNNQARSEMTVADPVPTSDEWSDRWDAAIQPGEPAARIDRSATTIPRDSDQMGCSL